MTASSDPDRDRPLLDVDDLHVDLAGPDGPVQAVRGVSFSVGRERLAIVGESGSGKSVSMRAVLGLLPASARVRARRLRFDRVDLLAADARAMRALRGARIGMIVQDPRQGFDPLMTIGAQLAEMLRWHDPSARVLARAALRARVHGQLADVQIRDPERVAQLYPHQLSGGMAQRAMIAMMLSAQPDLLIADEATSALDVVLRERILALIDEQVRRRGMGLVLISHDLELVARFADRVLVMYGGRILERLDAGAGMMNPQHPYTRGLLTCRPTLAQAPGQRLPVLNRDPAWLS